MKKLLLTSLVAATAMTVSCSKDQKQDIQNRGQKQDIQKTYATNCGPSDIPTYNSREFYQFDGAALVQVNEYYADAACTQGAFQTRYNGSYEIKGDSASIAGGRELTYKLDAVNVTPLSEGGITALTVWENVVNCKKSGWVVNQPMDYTDVAKNTGCNLTDVPVSGWLTIKDDNNGDTITLSKPTVGDVKPTSLDTKVYQKIDRKF